ncbi:signal transduction histidine kinase [Mycolicibacterium sp. BK556]|uniref:HAMP domain-containing sensor histidine kinase n=1 Tax=unclassified Mycolicibacterium TaxID=2636767 RepID=UPI001610D28F|nr:signal transduction histidine kinase [Mycolicibacterium sp. BK556]MBB3631220.1 signal transduction histidine kinase [Mycolicibacterium sp. BK607]
MGVRVRLILVVLLLLAVTALAVPLGLSVADRRTSALAAERDRQIMALADEAAVAGSPLQQVVDRYHEVYREGVLVVDSDGKTLAAKGLAESDPGVRSATDHALVDAPTSPWTRIRPWDQGRVLVTAGIRRDGQLVGAVVAAADTSAAARGVAIAWMWVGLGSVVLLTLAVLVARGLTRWVLRPLTGLEQAVAEMTEGVAGPPANVAGPPELRHFTAAFNKMSQVVRASLERQRRLVADASHQLRNPLAAVRLRADTLEENVTESGQATYQSMSAELDRLENLLHQLLRLARAEEISGTRKAGLAGAVTESTDVADVIAERITFWQPVADPRNQQLHNHSQLPGPAVQLARHDVEQLLDIAIDNALRYAGEGTTVSLSAVRTDTDIEMLVSDDGQGLAEADLSKAATRFWRGQKDIAGTGLGLAIAAEITAGHGGAIALENAPEGGLLVRFHLPAADEAVS